MKKLPVILIPFFIGSLILTGGCNTVKTNERSVKSADELVDYLVKSGIGLQYQGPTSSAPLTVPAIEYIVSNGGLLLIHEYKSEAAAFQDYALIDGKQDFIRSPHVFFMNKLVVIYSGNDSRVEQKLSDVLGPAGS